MSRRGFRTFSALAGVAMAASAAAFAYGSLIERRAYALREVTVPVLPEGSRTIRILHLSDLHMAPWQSEKQSWVRELAHLQPDMIVDTGDNLGHADGIQGVRAALEPFKGIPGVFAHGSNDYFAPTPKNPFRYFLGPSDHRHQQPDRLDVDALNAFFTELGWVNLNNAATTLLVQGTTVEMFGVDDPHIGFDRLSSLPGALDELREAEGRPEKTGDAAQHGTVTIGVAHAPYRRVLDAFVTNGAQLILAGHTHGGQVCLPGYGALVTNCDIPRAQVKGLSVWRHGMRGAFLNVSAGVGTSIYAPVRFACRPEVTLLTLVPVRNTPATRVS